MPPHMRRSGGPTSTPPCQDGQSFPDQEVERAAKLAQKALTLDPATTSAYRLLAVVHLFGRQYDLALAQIDRALEINPNDSDSYVYRAVILVFAGNL